MKLGFAMVSNVTNPERAAIAQRAFQSLANTTMNGLDEKPAIEIMYNPISQFKYNELSKLLVPAWEIMLDEDKAVGFNAIVSVAGDLLLEDNPEVTHIGFLWDDFVYNRNWLIELQQLIKRHPDGIAWSIYRSSYTRHHRIIGGDGTDVLMTMHDGVGTMTKEEWKLYGASRRTDFTVPGDHNGGGNTIDCHHAYERPGNRWATNRDFCQNLGVHAWLGRQDQAIDFVGE